MKRLNQWETERRRQIEEELNRDTVIAMVAREPYLLMKVLALVEEQGLGDSDAVCQIVGQGLARTARAVSFEAVEPVGAPAHRPHRRDATEWVSLLEELGTELANGQFYNRDLPSIDEPLASVVDRYLRRRKA